MTFLYHTILYFPGQSIWENDLEDEDGILPSVIEIYSVTSDISTIYSFLSRIFEREKEYEENKVSKDQRRTYRLYEEAYV